MKLYKLILTLALATLANYVYADTTVVENHKSTFTIVIPENSSNSVRDAAQELQRDIHLATNVKLPINIDSKITANVISLGETEFARKAGLKTDGMEDEGFHILSKDGNLYIYGIDTPDGKWTKDGGVSNGTANGVYVFLEDYLGVRWLMPGDIGRDVPRKSIFNIGDIDRTETPTFHWRKMPHISSYSKSASFVGEEGDIYLRNIYDWATYQRVGTYTFNNSSIRLDNKEFDHNFWETINKGFGEKAIRDVKTEAIDKAYKQHPDWFAMDDKGKRLRPKTSYYKLETTNPELVKWFAGQAVKTLKENNDNGKRPIAFSLSPSDGSGWSESPESKALYDPPILNINDPEAPAGQPSTSSLVLKWYHDVAQEVRKKYPQGRLAGYIYGSYVFPPTKIDAKLPDNFTPVLCGIGTYGYGLYREANQKRWESVVDSWAKVAPENWFYYDLPAQFTRQERDGGSTGYSRFEGGTGIISSPAPDILNRVFHKIDSVGMKGALIYATSAWSGNALSNYITAKMMWNPKLDANDLQSEWLHRAYGKAAGEKMEIFYKKLDDIFRTEYQKHGDYGHKVSSDILKTIYADHYSELENLFIDAAQQPMTAIEQERFDMLQQNMIVLQWRLRNLGYLSSEFHSSLQRNDAAIAEIIEAAHSDINYFPGVISAANAKGVPQYSKMKIKKIQFTTSAVPEQDNSSLLPNKNTFLITATKNQKIQIVPRRVDHSATFATYILKGRGGNQGIIKSGLLAQGEPIVFNAKARRDYYLYVVPRLGTGFELQFKDAALIDHSSFDHKTGTLLIKNDGANVYVLGDKMMSKAAGKDVVMATPLSLDDLQKNFSDARLQDISEAWKFHPVTQDDKKYFSLSFDDARWDDMNAGNWWQMQGEKYEKYNGAAWYRKKISVTDITDNQKVLLYFGAIDGNAEIYLNGEKVGDHLLSKSDNYAGWDQPFYFDVTNFVHAGENSLAVRVANKGTGASGLQGEVNLLIGVPITNNTK